MTNLAAELKKYFRYTSLHPIYRSNRSSVRPIYKSKASVVPIYRARVKFSRPKAFRLLEDGLVRPSLIYRSEVRSDFVVKKKAPNRGTAVKSFPKRKRCGQISFRRKKSKTKKSLVKRFSDSQSNPASFLASSFNYSIIFLKNF